MANVATTDVTVAAIDAMEPIHGGLARRARATLGVSAWGMQVLTLPPDWDGYPEHNHDATAFDPNQEEVYIPLEQAGGDLLLTAAAYMLINLAVDMVYAFIDPRVRYS